MRALFAHKRAFAISGVLIASAIAGGAYYRSVTHSPEAYLARAIQLDQRGERAAAEIELKNALQLNPDNAEARFRLGRIHFANNDFASAEKELRQALQHGHTDPELQVLLARVLLAQGEHERVLNEIEEVATAPDAINATLLALRAQAALQTGEGDLAKNALAAADTRVPDHPDALAVRALMAVKAGEPPEHALELVQKALANNAQRADLWLMQGDLLRAAKRAEDEALAAYRKALEIEPVNVPARLATVRMLLERNDLDQAERTLQPLAKQAPNNLLGRYLAALIDFRRGRLDEANNKLTAVLNSAPNFLPANLLAGIIHLSQDKRESANSYLGKVLDMAPDHALARKLLSASMLSAGRVDEAKRIADRLRADNDDALMLSLQGNIALRQGDFQAARRTLEKAAELAPDNPALMREVAASRLGSGDESGAVQALQRMAELDPGSNQAEVLLVITHLRSKRFDDALRTVAQLETKRPGQAVTHNLRGIVHAAAGDTAKARDSFQQALKIDAGYFPAANNLANLDLADKDAKTARGRFEQLLKHAPNNSRAWVALAELARAENREADFVSNLEKATRADPKDVRARMMLARYWLARRDAGKAMAEARAGLDATGEAQFHDVIGSAQALQGDHVNALASFVKWAELQPGAPQAHFKLAQAQLVQKNPAAALGALDRALALRPDFLDAAFTKVMTLEQLGRRDDALALARDLQGKHAQSGVGFLAEAEVRMAAKQYSDAARLYVRAAQLSGQGQAMVGAYRAHALNAQPAEGEKLLRQWLGNHPKDAAVRHQLGQGLLSQGRQREAAEQYEVLTRDNPRDVIALNNLAWLYGQLNDGRALATAEQAHKLAPDNAAVLDTLGWQLVNSGQAKRGVDLIAKAHGKAPQSADIHWHYVVGLKQAGDRTRARQELLRLLNSRAEFPQKTEAVKLLETL